MNFDIDSVKKTAYFVGALKRISMREAPNQIGTIDEIKKLISKRVEYDKNSSQKSLKLDSDFKFTDEELFSLIDLFYDMGAIGKGTKHGELIHVHCKDGLQYIIHDKISQGILISMLTLPKSESVTNSINVASE